MVFRHPNATIYEIRCFETGKIYVGSTINQTLKKRLLKHECDYLQFLRGERTYLTSFDILENKNFEIYLLEYFPVNYVEELREREGLYIKKFKELSLPIVNKFIPGRTKKEHYEDNKERIKKKLKEYRKINKEKIAEKQNKKIICECGTSSTNKHLARHKRTDKHKRLMEKKN